MRYSRAERLIQLALEMQAARGGLTISDIMEKFDVSRRTAIRMRDAVIRAFPQADEVPSSDRSKRWRLPNGTAQVLAGITADDLATLEAAAEAFDHSNLKIHGERLRLLSAKVRAILKDHEMRQIDPDLEALMEAEGLAHRPGPKPMIPATTFELLREAIKSCRRVSFRYQSRNSNGESHRTLCPLGFLYGHRHYLVAQTEPGESVKFYSLPAISDIALLEDTFEREPSFDLRAFVSQSFGVFEEKPVHVVWRFSAEAAPSASQFVFHHSQNFEHQPDGSLIVRFTAGGQLEMAWHLICWGEHVEVLEPQSLAALLPKQAPSWPALP
jgi:predicted DNA-binding transcriptional regulator YafY